MNTQSRHLKRPPFNSLWALGLILFSLGSWAQEKPSNTEQALATDEMLTLVDHSRLKIYRPEAVKDSQFPSAQYTNLTIKPVTVEFNKNWRRDHNISQSSLSTHINKQDEEELKGKVAKLFDAEFSKQLTAAGRFQLDKPSTGSTLIIQPRIVKLAINAPDLKHGSINSTRVFSAGRGTLVLEIFDAASGQQLGTISDKKYATEYTRPRRASSVFNRSEAKHVIRRWAKYLERNLTTLLDGTSV